MNNVCHQICQNYLKVCSVDINLLLALYAWFRLLVCCFFCKSPFFNYDISILYLKCMHLTCFYSHLFSISVRLKIVHNIWASSGNTCNYICNCIDQIINMLIIIVCFCLGIGNELPVLLLLLFSCFVILTNMLTKIL